MEYLGKRFQGNHSMVLNIANANFSLFKEDFEIADVIREIQEKYDWPKSMEVNSGKDPKKLLNLVNRLKYKFLPAIALQTLTPAVLKNIGRINIPFDSFIAFQKEVSRTIEANPATELILSLPEETKETFLATLRQVLNSGVQNIVIFTLMSLRGTKLDTPGAAEKYGHVYRYRIVPRCISEIDGEKIFETEKVVVGTKSMPYEDYLELRGLSLLVAAFASSIELTPLRRILLVYGVDLAKWIEAIQKSIQLHAQLSKVYEQFIAESKYELYDTPEAVKKFFGQPDKFQQLLEGKYGDNLLRKYKTILLSNYFQDCLEIAYEEALRLSETEAAQKMPGGLLPDLKTYLSSRDMGRIFRDGYDPKTMAQITLQYDIPRWLANAGEIENLENYHGQFAYTLAVTDYIQQRLRDFRISNRDPVLSLQMLYRDGAIRDFWPQWVPIAQPAFQ
jgi:hypothetical protein